MPNFKKFVAVSLSAICLMASCSKTLNAEGAKKFVESQYAKATLKTFKGVGIIANAKPASDAESKEAADALLSDLSRQTGIAYTEGSYSLRGDAIEGSDLYKQFKEFCAAKITSNDINEYEKIKEETEEGKGSVIYTTNSGELSVYCNFRAKKEITLEQNGSELDIYDTCGQLRYVKQTIEIKDDKHSVSGSIVSTVNFTK